MNDDVSYCEVCGSARQRNLVYHYKKAGIETSSFDLYKHPMFGLVGCRCIPCLIRGRVPDGRSVGFIRYADDLQLKIDVNKYRKNHSGVWAERWVYEYL